MAAFTDWFGRTWQIELTATALQEIRDDLKIDLLAELAGGPARTAALWGMGAGPADRIAQATEATAKNTKKVVDRMGRGATFA